MKAFWWEEIISTVIGTWKQRPDLPKRQYPKPAPFRRSGPQNERPLMYGEVLYWKERCRHEMPDFYYSQFPEELN